MAVKTIDEKVHGYVIFSINSSIHCDKILENHNCFCSSFVPVVGNDIGIYSFQEPLEESVLEALKNVGCLIYKRI